MIRLNRAIPEDGFSASVDVFIGDECLRLFWKPWSFGYWFHRWGFYGYGFGWLGCMFWPAEAQAPGEREL